MLIVVKVYEQEDIENINTFTSKKIMQVILDDICDMLIEKT